MAFLMRVISGIYGGRRLKSPTGTKTRPTSDRLRETLFNILGPRINEETRFLDLCAGTGAVGLEALSRGAGFVGFIEKARSNCALIEENLDLIHVPEKNTLVEAVDAEKYLRQYEGPKWSIVFYDPPYNTNYARVLGVFQERPEGLLDSGGLLVAEHHYKTLLPDEIGPLRRWRILKQGETALSFYEDA